MWHCVDLENGHTKCFKETDRNEDIGSVMIDKIVSRNSASISNLTEINKIVKNSGCSRLFQRSKSASVLKEITNKNTADERSLNNTNF